jgi:peptidoglycan hydrolase-like protein with peptidoglycan-binding domain
MRLLVAAALVLALPACGLNGTDGEEDEASAAADRSSLDDNGADTMRSNDPAEGARASVDIPDSEERPIMQAQVVLDRHGFGPGVIDGKMGISTENALKGFQEANKLEVTGKLDEQTRAALAKWDNIPATRVVTIPEDWGTAQYREVPEEPEDQAKLQRLGYESLDERLAERFHTTVEVLEQLNPGGRPAGMAQGTDTPVATGGQATARANATAAASPSPSGTASATGSSTIAKFRAGQQVRVPNIGADRIDASKVQDKTWQQTLASLGVGTDQPEVAKIVVDKSEGWLKGYDGAGKLVAMFTVTTGSSRDPLPLGNWGITGISRNPPFAFDPELFWDVPDTEDKQQLPPGPNGPVGVVWIDLTKEHYGIHGTNAPETIGRAQSHGCVRLTNWDAARLAEMVDTNTKVVFQA